VVPSVATRLYVPLFSRRSRHRPLARSLALSRSFTLIDRSPAGSGQLIFLASASLICGLSDGAHRLRVAADGLRSGEAGKFNEIR